MKHQTVNVTEFKAKCLALLDGLAENGGTITITRRGKPLAEVGPARRKTWKSPEGILAGKVTIPDELLNPTDMSDMWEVVSHPGRFKI